MKFYESTATIQASPRRAILTDCAQSMPDLGPSFEQFAKGLKSRAENGA